MRQIMHSTDGKFVGLIFDPDEPILLDSILFIPDYITEIGSHMYRYSNSNYILDVREI